MGAKQSANVKTSREGEIIDGRICLSTKLEDTYVTMPPKQEAQIVDKRDADTPDHWVKRHEDMVRLTGRHPFNSEPPLRALQEAGWITPASLHVVRNHGAVPQLNWATHKLQVSGTPRGDISISMDDLASGAYGPVVSFPVTFICAGNRRKEQNMTKKTIGFNWGCGAVGNSVWTGVRLCDVLAKLGVTQVSKQHRYVHFAGPSGELPKGETGEYGTSIDMGWALDRERDVLLAFKQNGELLTPDHGAPLRTLLPGCIGGRMIKWLCTMHMSAEASQNHYHFFDNRVLPPHVDADLANKEGWWYKPEYIINHININSAMFEPRHNSFFRTDRVDFHPTMKVCGYAYVGGGLKIIRAEISLDGGSSWEIADLTRPEDSIADARGTDKHWCWSWWETEVEATKLKDCSEICCRAVDSNQNTQPMFLTWNVMGMMNNCLFRIKVHQLADGTGVWFEHPTMPGNEPGGWMTEEAGTFKASLATECADGHLGVAVSRPVAALWAYDKAVKAVALESDRNHGAARPIELPAEAGTLVKSTEDWLKNGISMEEVEKHNQADSAWIVVKDRVYDCTPFLNDHPGGASSIMIAAGMEATDDFEAVHSKRAWDMLRDYYIGFLRKDGGVPAPLASKAVDADVCFLKPREFQTLPLAEKLILNHDTRIFRFKLPHPDMRLGLPTGQHIFLRATYEGKVVMRPYSPLSDDATRGYVDFIIKVYFKDVHPKFPQGGKMSQHLDSMKIGDLIEVKGPLGDFIYNGEGNFTWKGNPRVCKNISLIAGGTGISLPYQVLSAVLRNPEDQTKVKLLFANQTPDDILAREQLETLAASHPDRFELWYTVDRLKEDKGPWKYDVGFINDVLISKSLFPPADDTICLMCGPPIMYEKACIPNLLQIGYKHDNIFEG